jgi:flagellum-specific peptidoglycan hydrolase FlgJ
MAPPGKPSTPVVTARTAESLTVDWPSVVGVSYVLRARDPADPPVELAIAAPPARIEDLLTNELYLVTLEALNADGGSGETAPVAEWTDPPAPKTAPAAYVSPRDGTVSIGWDLTSELVALRHRDTIAVEVGRLDGTSPVPKIVADGKIRDLCFDLGAPVGLLRYQLRLRADRPPPQTPVFSQWGAATAVSKLMPGGTTQGNTPSRNDLTSPLIGGQAFRTLSFLAAKEEGDDDGGDSDHDRDSKNDETKNTAPHDDRSTGAGQDGDRGSSRGDGSYVIPKDDASDPNKDTHMLPLDPVTGAVTPGKEAPYQLRWTDEGMQRRHMEADGQGGWRPAGAGEWRNWDNSIAQEKQAADPNDLLERHGMMPVRGPALPGAPQARPTPQSSEDARMDGGRLHGQLFFRLPPEQSEQHPNSSRDDFGIGLRSDRVDTPRRQSPAASSSKRAAGFEGRRAATPPLRRNKPASSSLLDHFAAWMRSELGLGASPKIPPAARRPGPTGTFPQNVVDAARESEKKWGVPAEVTRAQWALESNWGRNMPAGSNNPFGIKIRPGSKEAFVTARTWEVVKGKKVKGPAKFRAFDSLDEAFDLHARLLARAKPYRNAMKVKDDADAFADALTGVYATDPNYGMKLKSIMKAHRSRDQ